ncbi:MAG: hypothetical protein ACXVPN_11100 [Bacteroidia bacterium]
MKEINQAELNTAKEIISAGLSRAAESLSFFMKEKISLDEMDYSFNMDSGSSNYISKTGNNIHLLITEVIGELKGICCLIFSEAEAERLRQTALPPEIINNPSIMQEMSDGILLEVDNIISASVITQFSNILKHKIHGGVPAIKKLSAAEVNEFIESKLQKDMFVISFNTNFVSSHIDFSPQFLWLFDNSFAESVKRLANENGVKKAM